MGVSHHLKILSTLLYVVFLKIRPTHTANPLHNNFEFFLPSTIMSRHFTRTCLERIGPNNEQQPLLEVNLPHQVTRYTLLNDNGAPQHGHYIEVHRWPSNHSLIGKAFYAALGEPDEALQFTLNPRTNILSTHPIRAPEQRFDMAPVIENGELVELLMDLGDDTATFVFRTEEYELEDEDDLDSLRLGIVELTTVHF